MAVKTPIAKKNYENVRAMILSGQIAQEDVPQLLNKDKAFGRWYVAQQVAVREAVPAEPKQ